VARETAKEAVQKELLFTETELISTKKQALPLEAAETLHEKPSEGYAEQS
jgi:hypothetical protein